MSWATHSERHFGQYPIDSQLRAIRLSCATLIACRTQNPRSCVQALQRRSLPTDRHDKAAAGRRDGMRHREFMTPDYSHDEASQYGAKNLSFRCRTSFTVGTERFLAKAIASEDLRDLQLPLKSFCRASVFMKVSSNPGEQAQPADSISGYHPPAGDLLPPQQTGQPAGADIRVVTKFLITNAAAGSVIGKNGTNIQHCQNQTGARMQLSRTGELFPGTNDRIILLAGTSRQVSSALQLMLDNLNTGERRPSGSLTTSDGKDQQLRLLVPAALCGAIIGKGGATIRGFGAESQTNITVSNSDRQPPGVPDRIVRITGQFDITGRTGLLKAMSLLTDQLLKSPNYSRVTRTSVGYARPAAYRAPSSGYGQEYADRPEALDYPSTGYNTEGRVEVIVPVPDSRIGAIIGKKGEVINQLKALCDVRIRISDRDDFVPGTRNRKVSISGTAEAVGITQALIRQRLRASPQPLQYDDRRSPATAL